MSSISNTFVEQLYSRFLGRKADTAGLSFWSTILDSGSANAAEVTLHFLASREYSDAVQPVARLYYSAFGRIPDAGGLQFWIERAQAGTPLDAIAAAFTASSEFNARFGALDDGAFVDALYQSAVGHAVDAAGKAQLSAALANGSLSRASLLQQLAASGEVAALRDNAIQVIAQYHGTLGTAPTASDIASALQQDNPLTLLTTLYSDTNYHGAAVPGLADLAGTGGSKGGGAGTGDIFAPVIASSNPAGGQTGVSLTTLVFTFDEPIQKGSGNITLTNGVSQTIVSGGVLAQRIVGATDTRVFSVGDAAVSVSGNTMTITVPGGLQPTTNYSLMIAKGAIEDTLGNDFGGILNTTQLRFTTGLPPDVSAPYANSVQYSLGGFYNEGDTIDFVVHFSEIVIVDSDDNPVLDLETGAIDSVAQYISGSGTTSLLFRYTVKAGDTGNYLHLKPESSHVGQGLVGLVHDASNNFLDQAHILFSGLTYAGNGYGITNITVDTTAPGAPSLPDMEAADDYGDLSTDNLTKAARPDFTGTAEPYATVKLYDGSTEIGQDTADENGIWFITPTSDLTHGKHYLTAQQVDRAGNLNTAASAQLEVTIATNPISAPSTPALDVSSDSAPTGDGNTTFNLVTITGTGGLSNRAVFLYHNGDKIGELMSDVAGNYTGVLGLLNGTYNLTAKNQDAAGNLSAASSSFTLVVASPPPSSPALLGMDDSGTLADNITNDTTPRISGSAQTGTTVELYEGSTLLGSALSVGGYYTIQSSALASGSHSLFVRAIDGNNNYQDSSTATITIDITPPDAPAALALSVSSDTGTSHSDGVTKLGILTFSGADGSAGDGATLYIYNNGTQIHTATATAKGGYNFTMTLAASATPYSLTVRQLDAAGNLSDPSAATSITVDQTAPDAVTGTISLASGYDSAASDGNTNTDPVVLTGSGAPANSRVNIYVGGMYTAYTTADGSGVWTSGSITFGEGTHQVTVKAADLAGNESAASSAFSLTIDTMVPNPVTQVTMVESAGHGTSTTDNISSNQTPAFTGLTTGDGTVKIYSGTTVIASGTVSGGTFTTGASSMTFAHGTHSLVATVTDTAGNISTSYTFSIEIDTQAPLTAPSTPTLATASDTGTTLDNKTKLEYITIELGTIANGDRVAINVDGAITQIVTGDGGSKTATVQLTTEGAHPIKVAYVDAAGNVGSYSSTLSVTRDSTAEVISLSLSNDSNIPNDRITNLSNSTISGTGPEGETINLVIDGNPHTVIAGTGGLWDYSIFDNVGGTHSVTASYTDAAGNLGSSSLTFTVDKDAPDPDSENYTTNPDAITIGFDEDIYWNGVGNILIKNGGTTVATVTVADVVASGSNLSIDLSPLTTNLPDGYYTVVFPASLTDIAGNAASPGSTFVTIDTVAPTVSGLTVYQGNALHVTTSEWIVPGSGGAFEIWLAGSKLGEVTSFNNDSYLTLSNITSIPGVVQSNTNVYELRLVGVVDMAGNALPTTSLNFNLPIPA